VLATKQSGGGDARGALDLLLATLERITHNALRRQAIPIAAALGEDDVALRLIEVEHMTDPDGVGALAERAAALRRVGRHDEARRGFEAISTHADASAQQVRDAADALIVGSSVKRGGHWANEIDPARAAALVEAFGADR